MAILSVRWHRGFDLQRDLEQQIARGGFFIRAEPPPGVLYGAKLPVRFVVPDGAERRFEGNVLAATPGLGTAVTVPETVAIELAIAAGFEGHDRDPEHGWWDEPVAVAATPARSADPLARYDELTPPERLRLAQGGDRDARAAVLRDRNRSLHLHVLRNPQITVEEIIAIAKNPQSGTELLEFIASRSEWSNRAQVAEALARNPKAPQEVGIRAVGHLAPEALRQIAKGHGAPPHVVQAARKKVVG